MIGALIGDISGSRFEANNHKSKEFEFFDDRCRPTDDSIMSLAVARAILDCDGDYSDLSKKAIARMQELGRIYENAGYGGTFIKWINTDDPKPYNSFGNGSAMRVGPCGYAAKSIDEAKMLSAKVSEVSHNHPEGMKGAEAVTVAIFLARSGKSKEEIRTYMDENYYKVDFTLDDIRDTYKFDVSCQGSVPVALEAFYESESLEDAVRGAISVGGDSDTIASIAGAIAEAYWGVPEEIIYDTTEYLDSRQMEILYYFEKAFPSKTVEEHDEDSDGQTVYNILDETVDKVIPEGTTVEIDENYEGIGARVRVDNKDLRPDFSSFDKEEQEEIKPHKDAHKKLDPLKVGIGVVAGILVGLLINSGKGKK